MEFHDDEAGTLFADVHDALAQAGFEASPICVAADPERGVFGIGCGFNHKFRETSAKLALALSIVNATGDAGALPQNYSEFIPMAQLAGISLAGIASRPTRVAPTVASKPSVPARGPSVPVPTAKYIAVAEASPLVEVGLANSGPAVMHDGKNAKASFSNVAYIYSEVVLNPDSIEFHDDEEGSLFPDVHAGLQAVGFDETPICIAADPAMGVWGVGCAYSKKCREQAAKFSLCAAVVAARGDGTNVARKYPEFGALCDSLGVSWDEPAAKRIRAA